MASSPSQKDAFIVIDESERPPVVAYGGRSPQKSPAQRKNQNYEFDRSAGNGPYIYNSAISSPPNPNGFGGSGTITPRSKNEQIGEWKWDGRHHVSPSQFNAINHTFYKVRKISTF